MTDPLNITNEMRALDLKQRDWYDSLTPEQQRKFSPYLMLRWGSSVQGSDELLEYYIRSTNQRLNRHFFSVNAARHKKLLWLMATAISPDLGVHRHPWLAHKRAERDTAKAKIIREYWPHLRDDEVELMAQINSPADIKAYIKAHGDDK